MLRLCAGRRTSGIKTAPRKIFYRTYTVAYVLCTQVSDGVYQRFDGGTRQIELAAKPFLTTHVPGRGTHVPEKPVIPGRGESGAIFRGNPAGCSETRGHKTFRFRAKGNDMGRRRSRPFCTHRITCNNIFAWICSVARRVKIKTAPFRRNNPDEIRPSGFS